MKGFTLYWRRAKRMCWLLLWVEPKVVSIFPHGSHMAGMDREEPPSCHVSRGSQWSFSMVILAPASQATVAEIDLCIARCSLIGSFR